VVTEILRKLPDASLDAESAVEIAANAIQANRLDVLDAVLSHHDFRGDGYVPRINGYPEQMRFERQLSQHSTRLLDVLLEAAVRCYQPWPFLRRLDDGTIGMNHESCRTKPDLLDIYSVWERQNKPSIHRLGMTPFPCMTE
jgi:hypothetical protein